MSCDGRRVCIRVCGLCLCDYDDFVWLVKRIHLRFEAVRKLHVFQAAMYFTHEVQQRELIGEGEMKLGQCTHQVFTKRNFSSFTVLSRKGPA